MTRSVSSAAGCAGEPLEALSACTAAHSAPDSPPPSCANVSNASSHLRTNTSPPATSKNSPLPLSWPPQVWCTKWMPCSGNVRTAEERPAANAARTGGMSRTPQNLEPTADQGCQPQYVKLYPCCSPVHCLLSMPNVIPAGQPRHRSAADPSLMPQPPALMPSARRRYVRSVRGRQHCTGIITGARPWAGARAREHATCAGTATIVRLCPGARPTTRSHSMHE